MGDIKELYREQLDVWSTDPAGFIIEAMRVDYLMNQQEVFFHHLGKFMFFNRIAHLKKELESTAIMKNRVIADKKAERLTTQILALESWNDYEESKYYTNRAGFTISSGRDLGKTSGMAMLVPWFMMCCEKPQGYILSPSGQQAKSILVSEIDYWINRQIENPETGELEDAFIFRKFFEVTSEKIVFKGFEKQRFVEVKRIDMNRSAEEVTVSLSGFHTTEQIFFMDEAIYFPEFVFNVINATNANPLNFLIAAFNPVVQSAYAVDAVFGEKSQFYIPFVWSGEKSNKPGIADVIKKREQEYGGTDNDLYRVNVQGLPPTSSGDCFMQIAWIMQAYGRAPIFNPKNTDSDYYCIGHDVAGQGADDAVTVVRHNTDIISIFTHSGKDENFQASFLYELYLQYGSKVKEINIDTIGIGQAVYLILKRNCFVAKSIKGSEKPTRKTKLFFNKRAQMYWELRERFKNYTVSINLQHGTQYFERLRRELIATERKERVDEKIQIIEKKKIKEKLGGRSPDVADAVALAFCGNDYSQMLDTDEVSSTIDYWDMKFKHRNKSKAASWMGS